MILFADPGVCDVCISYLALGGIVALSGGLGYAICFILNLDPSINLDQKLITNGEALEMIHHYKASDKDGTESGHLDLGFLLAYIDKTKKRIETIGKDLSGLQYYFAKYLDSDNTQYKNCTTIVIYPTYEDGVDVNGDPVHIPFDPFLSTSQNIVKVVDLNVLRTDVLANRKSDVSGWLLSENVLDKSNMSPPKPPLTL